MAPTAFLALANYASGSLALFPINRTARSARLPTWRR
jgi:hypothetical protein